MRPYLPLVGITAKATFSQLSKWEFRIELCSPSLDQTFSFIAWFCLLATESAVLIPVLSKPLSSFPHHLLLAFAPILKTFHELFYYITSFQRKILYCSSQLPTAWRLQFHFAFHQNTFKQKIQFNLFILNMVLLNITIKKWIFAITF